MAEPSGREKLETIRANIFADTVVRCVRWAFFLAIMWWLAVPLACKAWETVGALIALCVLALCVALAWQVAPHGPSYRKQVRDIEARYKPD